MSSLSKKLVVSTVSILVVLSVLAGTTMAWFTDTERVGAAFTAGVLDIEIDASQRDPVTNIMEFQNLRPLTMAQLKAELDATDFSNVNQEGFQPIPKYFHPVTVKNTGTLPAQVVLSVVDGGPCAEQISNVMPNGIGGVKQDGTIACEDAYILKEVLQILVYQNTGTKAEPVWTMVNGVNLNEATGGGAYQPYDLANPLGAGEEEQFIIAGYLPENVGNTYQAKHFHSILNVAAGQADEGAEIPGGSGSPEEPGEVQGTVKVQYVTDYDLVVGEYELPISLKEGATTTIQPDTDKLPLGCVLDPEDQSATVSARDGVLSSEVVQFTVRVQLLINYIDEATSQSVGYVIVDLDPKPTEGQEYAYTTQSLEVADNLPAGYKFVTPEQRSTLKYPDDFSNGPGAVMFTVTPIV